MKCCYQNLFCHKRVFIFQITTKSSIVRSPTICYAHIVDCKHQIAIVYILTRLPKMDKSALTRRNENRPNQKDTRRMTVVSNIEHIFTVMLNTHPWTINTKILYAYLSIQFHMLLIVDGVASAYVREISF